MYKVCFVDDEIINHKLMENLVDWKALGFDVAGTATDGMEALDLYEKVKPDLMFIDIKMPIMDGLECIRRIRQIDLEVQLVLVTAFSEFTYAQKAIIYNVKDYLLKPVSRAEINELAFKIKHWLDAKYEQAASFNGIQKEFRENKLNLLFRQALSSVQSGEHVELQHSDKYDEFFKIPLNVLDLQFYDIYYIPLNPIDAQMAVDEIIKLLNRCSISVQSIIPLEASRIVFLTEFSTAKQEELFLEIIKMAEYSQYCVDIHTLKYPLSVQKLVSVFSNMNPEAQNGFYQNKTQVYYDNNEFCYNEGEILRDGLDHLLVKSLGELDPYPLIAFVEEKIDWAEKCSLKPSILKNFCFDLLAELKLKLKDFFPFDTFSVLRSVNVQDLNTIKKSKLLKKILREYLQKTFSDLDNQMKLNSRDQLIIMQANAYCSANFAQTSFSVLDVANYVGISKNYFVKIYKQTAGINFWDYVTALRMDKAKELLKTTDDTIATISRYVGYESEYHFSRKFKENIGQTPNQYRKIKKQ